MNNRGYLYYVLISLAAIIILVWLLAQKSCCPKCPSIITKTDTSYITVKTIDTIYKVKVSKEYMPLFKTDTFFQFENTFIRDTVNVLGDYFSVKIYNDTQNIRYGKAIITDTVSQNRIMKRHLSITQNLPQISTTHIIYEQPKTQLYLGGGFAEDYNFTTQPYLSASVKTKKDLQFDFSIIGIKKEDRQYLFGVQKKIHLR